MKKLFILLLALGVLAGCAGEKSPWDNPDAWFQTGEEVNPAYADVLWYVSTEVWSSADEDGNQSLRALLSADERANIQHEMEYIRKNFYPDSLNFFSPFYHQVTMDGFSAPREELQRVQTATEQECLEAFNYYMDKLNGGRPYVLAGFSQGGMVVKSLLKAMTDEQYSNMVAAYVIGEEINAEDLQSPHIIPAQSAADRGVTISFNSVCDVNDIWDVVCSDPVACINPINWTTDATPATIQTADVFLSVAVDPDYQVVVVTGFGDNPPKPAFDAPWPSGCLHNQEIILYAPYILRNTLDRAY